MRIRKCWVGTCESSAEREKDKGVTFHKLPKDDGLKIKWLIQCRLSEDTDKKQCLVCSRHFRRVDFEALKASTFALKSDAIPTIFPWGITRLEELDSKFSSLDVTPLNTMDFNNSVESETKFSNTDLFTDNNDTKEVKKEEVLPKDDTKKFECMDEDVSLTNKPKNMGESSTEVAESLIKMSECLIEVTKPCVKNEINCKTENLEFIKDVKQENDDILCESTSTFEKQSNTVEENMSEMYGEIIEEDKDQDILNPKSADSSSHECHPIPEIDSIFENLFEEHKNATITSPNVSINSGNTEDELKGKSESDEESNKILKDMISKPMKPISKNQAKVGNIGRPRRRSPTSQKNQIRAKTKSFKQKLISKITTDEPSANVKPEKGMLVPGSRVEAKDFNDMWYPARVVEVDHDEMEVLIHYDNWSQRFDEWIYMWSPRIRIVDPAPPTLNTKPLTYEEGERCLARWSNNQRFPATVQKVLSNGQFEVVFDDGFTRVTKAAMMSKMNAPTIRVSTTSTTSTTSTVTTTRKSVTVPSLPSPTPLQNHLFDPKRDHLGTKEERRSLKKKIDVKELFFARKKKKEIQLSEEAKVNISVTKDGRGRKRKIKSEEDSLMKDPVQKVKKKTESQIKTDLPINDEADSEVTSSQPETSQFASSEKHSKPATQIANNLLINSPSQSLKIDVPDKIDSPKSINNQSPLPPVDVKEEILDEPVVKNETNISESIATTELSIIKSEPFDDTVECEITPSTSKSLDVISKSVPLNILGSPTSHALTPSLNPIANNMFLKSISSTGQTPTQTVTSTSTSKSLLTDYLTNSPSSNKSISSKFTLRASDRDWCCRWVNDQPVGIMIESESASDPKSGRVTIQVEDHRLPPGWRKLLTKRCINNSACKWDVVIVCPLGRRYRTRTEMQERLMEPDQNELESYALGLLDFSAHRKQARRKGWDVTTTSPVNTNVDFGVNMANKAKKAKPALVIPPPRIVAEVKPPSFHGKDFVFVGALKVQVIDNLLRCPKEGCFKNFRKDNLLQMHIKHYHPEMCKFFGDTPNVADLAYARTVVEETPSPVCKNQFKSEVDKYFDSVSGNKKSDVDEESTFNQTWNVNKMNSPNTLNESNVSYTFTPQGYKELNVSMEESNQCPKTSWGESSDKKNQGVYNYNTSRYFAPRPEVKRSHKKKLPEQLEESRSKKKKTGTFPYSWDAPTTDHDETRSSFGMVDQIGNRNFEHGITIKTEIHPVKIKEEKEESNHSSTIITETGEKIKIVQMKREEIINCHCGFCEEDGLMIQCELCLCWQHAMCHNIERESEVPDKYVCLICLQPYRGRKSQKYLHDQEWLYEGRLPRASASNPAVDIPRANLLRKSHELTANLLQLKDLMHSLRCKMEVAEKKDHPKLYLWSKPWENSVNVDMNSINNQTLIHTVDQEKSQTPTEKSDTTEKNDKFEQLLNHITEEANKVDPEILQNNGITESHINNGKCDLVNGSVSANIFSNLLASPGGTSIDLPLSSSELESLTKTVQISAPQPEAAIEPAECRIRLLQHIERTQVLLEARLDSIEAQIAELESQDPSFDDDETPEHFPRTKQTIQMILRDLVTLEELGNIS